MIDRTIDSYAKGVLGEARACEYLCQKGMVLLEQRYHSPFGEIDLVMQDGEVLVFAEVKLRRTGARYAGINAVTPQKQRRIVETAKAYLALHPATGPVRFDVVEVTREGVLHVPDAFQGTEW